MRKVTYSEIGGPDGLLARRQPFYGSSMSAYQVDFADGQFYVVFSYQTPIGWLEERTRTYWINPQRFSVTTSRHQGLMMAWLFGTAGRLGQPAPDYGLRVIAA